MLLQARVINFITQVAIVSLKTIAGEKGDQKKKKSKITNKRKTKRIEVNRNKWLKKPPF